MPKTKVSAFGVSLDGYGAGPHQSLENPLGEGGSALLDWLRATRTFHQRLMGEDGGSLGVDDDLTARSFENVGAWIMGRNMFGPVRGPWLNEDWKGWWGNDPVFHTPVFVLTHHPRASLSMIGGTTFNFVTDGIEAALRQAFEAANGKDIRIGGGAATIRQFLLAGLIDELHLAIAPMLLGSGEQFFTGVDMLKLGYRVTQHVSSPLAMHVILSRV